MLLQGFTQEQKNTKPGIQPKKFESKVLEKTPEQTTVFYMQRLFATKSHFHKQNLHWKLPYMKNWKFNDDYKDDEKKDNIMETMQNHLLECLQQSKVFYAECCLSNSSKIGCFVFVEDSYEISSSIPEYNKEKVALIKYIHCFHKNHKRKYQMELDDDVIFLMKVKLLRYIFFKMSQDDIMDTEFKWFVLLMPKDDKDHHYKNYVAEDVSIESKIQIKRQENHDENEDSDEDSYHYYQINQKNRSYALVNKIDKALVKMNENEIHTEYNSMYPSKVEFILRKLGTYKMYLGGTAIPQYIYVGEPGDLKELLEHDEAFKNNNLLPNLIKQATKMNKNEQKRIRQNSYGYKCTALPSGTLGTNTWSSFDSVGVLNAACSWLAMAKAVFFKDRNSKLHEKYMDMYNKNPSSYQYLYLDSSMDRVSSVMQKVAQDMRHYNIKFTNMKEKSLDWILSDDNIGTYVLLLQPSSSTVCSHCVTLDRTSDAETGVKVFDPHEGLIHFGKKKVNAVLFDKLCDSTAHRRCLGAKTAISFEKNETSTIKKRKVKSRKRELFRKKGKKK